MKEQMKEYYEQPEDVLTWAMFPQVAEKFFKARWTEHHGLTIQVEVHKVPISLSDPLLILQKMRSFLRKAFIFCLLPAFPCIINQ